MSRLRALAGMLGVAALLVLATASPATAHDQLTGTDPQDGAALETGPSEVTLTFSADVLDVGTEVIVSDGDGRHWVGGAPVLDGPTVTVPLTEALPEGGYEVRWRVVSGDGHPISGRLGFTVGDAEPLPVTGGDSETSESATSDSASGDSATATAVAEPTTSPDRPAWLPGVLVAIGGAALALCLWFLVRYFATRSQGEEP